jgi:mono/diheme cytochrome c family protein
MSIRRYCLSLLLLITIQGLIGCGAAEEERLAEGRELYIQECAHCHQIHGEGYAHVYPPLAGNPIVTLHNPEPTIEIVLYGRGSMPPFRNELGPEDIAKIISYIRTAWGNNASTVTPPQVR